MRLRRLRLDRPMQPEKVRVPRDLRGEVSSAYVTGNPSVDDVGKISRRFWFGTHEGVIKKSFLVSGIVEQQQKGRGATQEVVYPPQPNHLEYFSYEPQRVVLIENGRPVRRAKAAVKEAVRKAKEGVRANLEARRGPER